MSNSIAVADAVIAIGGDLTGFDKSLKAGGAMVDQTLGAKLKEVFSPKNIMGSVAGFAAGAAIAGANQLDAATRRLQADTGMTRAEAVKAEHALAGMFRNNLQGFDEIGAAMAAVHNDLGLVGDAADKATAKFLKFSTATGQEASGAVLAFDDILDAWNLTAADSGPLMDKLIASHQKYGGSITENQKALGTLAPQLVALGADVDDGIALLNLFAASGLDSSKATFALNTAVKNLKPGQSIDDLVRQVSAIEDPTLRAQKAIEIFGARGGVAMANILRPGIDSLDDFAISAEEAAGKTDEAAKNIEEGFGNKFKMLMKNAGGWLAEFGTNFGDLVMIAAAFGPQLTKAIGAGLGGLAAILIPKVTAAVLATGPGAAIAGSGVGTAIGTAMGAAIPLALVAAAGIGIALAFKAMVLDPGLQQQSRDIGKAVGEQIATGTTDQLIQSRDALEKGIADINALPLGGFLYGDQVRDLQTQLDAVNAALLEGGKEMPESVAAGIEQTTPTVEIAVEDLVKTLGTSMRGVLTASRITGADGMLAMAQGITAARQKPLDAFDTLKEMLKNAMSPMGEVARLRGQLTSKEFAAGLRSADPAVRAQAIAIRDAVYDRLADLAAGGGKAGKAAMEELDKGIRSKFPAVRQAALAAKNKALEQLNATKAPAGRAGTAAGAAFAAALRAAMTGSINAATAVQQSVARGLHQAGVPGYALGTPYVPRDQLALVHRGEIIVDREKADAIRSGQATLGGGRSSGGPITVNVYNPAPEPASTSTRRELRKLALSGSPM